MEVIRHQVSNVTCHPSDGGYPVTRLDFAAIHVEVDSEEKEWQAMSKIVREDHLPRKVRVDEDPEAEGDQELIDSGEFKEHGTPFPELPDRA